MAEGCTAAEGAVAGELPIITGWLRVPCLTGVTAVDCAVEGIVAGELWTVIGRTGDGALESTIKGWLPEQPGVRGRALEVGTWTM